MDEDVTEEPYASMKRWSDATSWEHLVDHIDTVEKTEDGKLYVYFQLYVPDLRSADRCSTWDFVGLGNMVTKCAVRRPAFAGRKCPIWYVCSRSYARVLS